MRSEEEREGERKKESREEFVVVVVEEQLLVGGQTRVSRTEEGRMEKSSGRSVMGDEASSDSLQCDAATTVPNETQTETQTPARGQAAWLEIVLQNHQKRLNSPRIRST